MRENRLRGSAYRYWSTFAISYVLGRRLQGQVAVLDAGGRDGGTALLLERLGLTGIYTCLDVSPSPGVLACKGIEVEYQQADFKSFKPRRRYDAVVFEGSLEYVADYADLSWLVGALKPRGFVLATLLTRSAYHLYRGFFASGGRYYRDEEELVDAFACIGLRLVEVLPLVGLTGRMLQHIVQRNLFWAIGRRARRMPGFRDTDHSPDPAESLSLKLNRATARLDRYAYRWPVGHCIVLEASNQPTEVGN